MNHICLRWRESKGRLRFAYVLGFCLLLLSSPSIGQHRIGFAHLSVQEGLSQSAVNCVLQDRQGFLWFGTQDGLNRFNGTSFTVFKHHPTDSTTINDNFIISLHEDVHGVLWVGTLNKPETFNRFDGVTETFSRVAKDRVDLKGARSAEVFSTYEDQLGVRWSGSVGGGLTRLDSRTGVKKEYKSDANNPASLSDNRVYAVYGDRSGTIWIGTREGLDRYDPITDAFVHYRHNDNDPHSLSDNWVWPIFEDRSGVLWVGTARGGLNRFDRATGRFTSYRHDPTNPRSLSDDFVLSIYQDRSGLMWVGTNGDGVNSFHPELGAFLHFANDPTNPNSLLDNTVRALAVDQAGTAWIGTPGGLSRFDPGTGRFHHYRHDPAKPTSLGEIPNVIFEDPFGMLWIGTFSNGLDRFNRTTGTFTHYRHDAARPNTLSDNRIYALAADRTGTLWVGTYGGGVNRFDRVTESFKAYTFDPTGRTGPTGRGVWALCVDHQGVLWVGTYGGGLNRYDPATQSFAAYKHDASDTTSISDDTIIALYEDRSHRLWIGTAGGLNRFDRSTGHFKRYREQNGLPNDFVFGILEDHRGRLWLSTNKGLSRFDPHTETFRNYDVNDGLQGNEFNQNAYAKSGRTGEMYFGGGNGMTLFHPDSIRDNTFVPPVVVCAFWRYNSDDEEGKPIEERGMPFRRHVELTYKDNIATFEFAALSFYNTFKNVYAYKLEGFSDNWIHLGSQHRATFTNLDPGTYTLRVRGANNHGIWNDEGATLVLTVTPPWWKTRWAYATYGMMVFGLLYGLRRFEINRREQKAMVRESELRTKAVEAEKRVLEVENDRKTKELEEARVLQLSMLPRTVPNLPHLDIAVFMKTATEVGGDYYDFLLDPSGTLTVACGDATGHGMQAGTVVTLTKGLFTSDAARLDIRSFLNHSSAALKNIKMGRLLMALTLLKIDGRRIAVATAGMPPVFVVRKASGTVDELMLKGMPLGAMKNLSYVVHEEELCEGDLILIISDGLPEQKNAVGEMFDYARIQHYLLQTPETTPETLIGTLWKAAEHWMNGAAQEDDITMIAIQFKQEKAMRGTQT